MVFDTEDTRDAYFLRVERDIYAVEYGSALAHASTVNLGFFGEEPDLFNDCSRIMLAEITKFACRRFCRLEDVHRCMVWHVLYNSARAEPRREMSIVYQELGEVKGNPALLEEAEKLKTQVVLSDMPPYQMVYEDIKRRQRG